MMKTLILILLVSGSAFAAGKAVSHKTADGKYPCVGMDVAGEGEWNDDDQNDWDTAMDEQLTNACYFAEKIAAAKAVIKEENAVGKSTGFVNAKALHDAGQILVTMEPKLKAFNKVFKEKTGTEAGSYECP